MRYQYWFKVANTIIGNINRAHATAVENSPNWQAAVQKITPNPTLNTTTSTGGN